MPMASGARLCSKASALAFLGATLWACRHTAPVGQAPPRPPSAPERAGAALGLRAHDPIAAPDWLVGAPSVWVKSDRGACVEFVRSTDYFTGRRSYRREVCRQELPNGDRISKSVGLELAVVPAPEPQGTGGDLPTPPPPAWGELTAEGGPFMIFHEGATGNLERADGGWSGRSSASWSRGPWYAVSATAREVRFESMARAWYLPRYESTRCDRESSGELEALDPEVARDRYAVYEGRKVCPREWEPMTSQVLDSSMHIDYHIPTVEVSGAVDCRLPCPPWRGGEPPDSVYISEDSLPDPLFRELDPEVERLFRTEEDCERSSARGSFKLYNVSCDQL